VRVLTVAIELSKGKSLAGEHKSSQQTPFEFLDSSVSCDLVYMTESVLTDGEGWLGFQTPFGPPLDVSKPTCFSSTPSSPGSVAACGKRPRSLHGCAWHVTPRSRYWQEYVVAQQREGTRGPWEGSGLMAASDAAGGSELKMQVFARCRLMPTIKDGLMWTGVSDLGCEKNWNAVCYV